VEAPFLSEKAAVLLAMVARLRQTVVVAVLLLHRLSLGEVTRQEEATCQEVSKVARIVGCPRSTPFTRFYTAKGDTFVVVRLFLANKGAPTGTTPLPLPVRLAWYCPRHSPPLEQDVPRLSVDLILLKRLIDGNTAQSSWLHRINFCLSTGPMSSSRASRSARAVNKAKGITLPVDNRPLPASWEQEAED
jgi:hypothetical protein